MRPQPWYWVRLRLIVGWEWLWYRDSQWVADSDIAAHLNRSDRRAQVRVIDWTRLHSHGPLTFTVRYRRRPRWPRLGAR